MIILEALAKAKRAREGQETTGEAEAAPLPQRPARGKIGESPIPAPIRLEFPQVSINPAICERNRVFLTRQKGHAYSAVLDAYRILRTRLWAQGVSTERWTSLGMVSAGPGEGKTLTAINLALSFAREKRNNVFLLDLDLRNPSVCRYLGVQPAVGIGHALTREAKPEDVFFSIGIDNLTIAAGTQGYENSSELLGGSALDALLASINKLDPHSLIVVDLPPLLLSADALVVAPKLSTVLLVVAEGYTRRDQLDRAIEVLHGTNVAGIVLNRSRESVEDYYG